MERSDVTFEPREGYFDPLGNRAYYNGHPGYDEPRRGYRQHNGITVHLAVMGNEDQDGARPEGGGLPAFSCRPLGKRTARGLCPSHPFLLLIEHGDLAINPTPALR